MPAGGRKSRISRLWLSRTPIVGRSAFPSREAWRSISIGASRPGRFDRRNVCTCPDELSDHLLEQIGVAQVALAVDRHDLVARAQAGLVGRRSRDSRRPNTGGCSMRGFA